MSLIITNSDLQPIRALLEDLPLAGAASRARSKLAAMVEAALESLAASELALITEYAQTNEAGEPMIGADGSITFATTQAGREFLAERTKLMNEQAELTGQSYTTMTTTLYEALLAYEEPLTGDAARAYDRLCDALEHHHATNQQEEAAS
ncbi:hypothetical protein [Trueperella pyogenes]|uniref:Uncharacterized protein n=1 Tax=Trueperella pyogenes TaxID=1661 RepID=A0ABV3NE49_9ACTO